MNEMRLVVITGANRGFGRALAVECARVWPGADMVLSSREGSKGVDETKAMVKAAGGTGELSDWQVDMASQGVAPSMKAALGGLLAGKAYTDVTLVNNAATLGRLAMMSELTEEEISQYMTVNVSSCLACTSAFLGMVEPLIESGSVKKASVVNVSSGLARNAKPGFAMYSAAKAGRDMAMKAGAADHPRVRFLNYSPGPMATDMAQEIRSTHPTEAVRSIFVGLKESGTIIDPFDSARVLWELRLHDTHENAAWHDYREVIKERASTS